MDILHNYYKKKHFKSTDSLLHCHCDRFVINSVSNHPHGKRIFTSAPMVTCFVRKPSRSHILEKIGILKRGSERCKPDRPLTVTQQLLQHHVTVEFQGSMGKFVQLSTQIRAYRNSLGRREKGVFLCVACTCVYTEILRTLKRSSFTGGIPVAEAETPPCILRRAVLTPLAE